MRLKQILMGLKNFLDKDNMLFGAVLGLILPVPTALVFLLLLRVSVAQLHILAGVRELDLLLLGIGANLLLLRYYLVNVRLEKTAKGLISITLLIAVLFFIFLRKTDFVLPF